MTKFWLIRHAETDTAGNTITGRLPGVHLNAMGRRQAELLVSQLRPAPLTAIYASPLERARETAAPLAQAKQLTILTCEAAIEVEFGEWSGKTWQELEAMPAWRRFNLLRSSTAAPGGELMLDVQARIVRAMENLRLRHADQDVAIISHGDIIRAAVAHYAGIPIDLFERIEISTASTTVMTLDEHRARFLTINRTVEL
ncbi:MAG TPA: histidine phosphatase family protein [Bryobacteraceae bacterium]|nr:histidine phosphatase family protein [Bryobacteraceae bacterium]